MEHVLIKVYGYLKTESTQMFYDLEQLLKPVVGKEIGITKTENFISISYEGIFFPINEVLEITKKYMPKITGQIDYIDVDEWYIMRYKLSENSIAASRRSLNDVLAFSGH